MGHFERQSHEVHVADWPRELGAGAVALHASPAHGSKKDVVTTGKTAARATNVTGLASHQVYHGRGVSQLGDFCAEGERASQRLRRGAQPWLESSCGPACLAQRRATLHVFSEADARTVSFPAARIGLTDLAVSRGCGEARYEVFCCLARRPRRCMSSESGRSTMCNSLLQEA